ncbi:MAG: DbpA RNA binding domain-containing protein [Spirochaetales bacterium]|jgi:hypothetical protein|nr:DbpA RNA binding domain-containing protein [Spirochaetales bacterium]
MQINNALQTRIAAAENEDQRVGAGSSAGRPLILPPFQKNIYDIFQTRKDAVLETDIHSGLFRGFLLPLIQVNAEQTGQKTLVIVPSAADVQALQNASGSITPETPEKIIDGLRRGDTCLRGIKRVVIACPREEACADFFADVQFIYSRTGFSPHTLVFTEDLHGGLRPIRKLLSRPKIIEKKDIIIVPAQGNAAAQTETIQDFIKEINRKIYEEDPLVLRRYKKLFKENVSLFNRCNAAAYLLKHLFERKSAGIPRFSQTARPNQPRADMKMLFFGLGKNRKVFPRDITSMILSRFPGMDRSGIGDIRILDSYSFVEVAENQAQAIIDALNGTEYRGKTLAVNYARKKES